MRIAIDQDDVQNNLIVHWVKDYNEKYNDNVTWEDVKSWDIQSYLTNCPPKELFKIIEEQDYFMKLDSLPDSLKVIRLLRTCGHDVVTVTSATAEMCVSKRDWLVKYSEFEPRDIIYCSRKDWIRADVLIDDKPENLENFVGIRILFTSNHNHNANEDMFDYRVDDWNELEELLMNLGILIY